MTMQPIAVSAEHVNAVRGVKGVRRARRGGYVNAHKVFLDVPGAGRLTMALYRVNGVARWYEGDTDNVLGLGAARSARALIAARKAERFARLARR